MKTEIIPVENIQNKIYLIRNQKVMLDKDLAGLYQITTGNLNKAVKRNIERFPDDFMFRLTKEETESLIFQIGTSKRGGSRHLPFVFTEQGVAMLSSVLNSQRAIQVNIQIMRTFINLRKLMLDTSKIQKQLQTLFEKTETHDKQFQVVFNAIKELITIKEKPKRPMGFNAKL